MIDIKYIRDKNIVTLDGHAGAAPKGEDLVCASATALVLTLAENVRAMEASGTASQITVDIEEGHAWIACTPARGQAAIVQLVFQVICMGFEGLQSAYPEHVRYGLEIEK